MGALLATSLVPYTPAYALRASPLPTPTPSSAYNRLWEDSLSECSSRGLKAEKGGAIPPWLKGSLIRNGPGCFGTDERKYLHLFDGLAKLTKFDFSGNADDPTFSARFIRSTWHKSIVEEGRMPPSVTTGPVSPPFSLLDNIAGAISPTAFDNVPVNIHQLGGQGGKWVAVTDAPVALEFNPQTLETVGRIAYRDAVTSSKAGVELFSTAHPHTSADGDTINYFLELNPLGSNTAMIVKTDNSLHRNVVGKVSLNHIPYVHDISITDKYAVLCLWPFKMDPLKLFNGRGFLPQLEWQWEGNDQGTRILVFDLSKERSEPVAEYSAPAMFAYHHINAFDTPAGDIVFDVSGYTSPGIVNGDHLFALLPNVKDPVQRRLQERDAKWFRYSLPLSFQRRGMVKPVELKAVCSGGKQFTSELVTISPRMQRRPHRYSYGFTGFAGDAGFEDWALVKLDHAAAAAAAAASSSSTATATTAQVWQQPNCFPSEPIFVHREGGEDEDDGVVLSQVYDATRQDSFLLLLDAKTMTELARCYLGMICPVSFHGKWIHG